MRFLGSEARFVALACWFSQAVLPVHSFVHPQRHSRRSLVSPSQSSSLEIKKKWFLPDSDLDDDDDYDDNDGLVTREMLHRDLLQDPRVKRKRKNGKEGYKPLDNRDHLPFSVRKITPDPYTHVEIKKAKQTNTGGKRKRTDLDHHLTPAPKKKSGGSCSSRLITSQKKDGMDTSTVLGEFQLDKSTTSGDIILIGDREYQVQKARCQYKYAGGQRFVMVRKILEVKEVTRVFKEEALIRQFESSPSQPYPDKPPNLE